jgi:L-fuconolactonase
MVRQCPETDFVLDHLGKPDIRRQQLVPWANDVRMLADCPNVVCKISGMLTEADPGDWSREDLRPYIDHVVQCFGFDRILYGGDWPVVTLAASYEDWMAALEWAFHGLSDADWQKLVRTNAKRVYRLDA